MLKQFWLEYSQFTIGYYQIILSRDYKILWIIVETIAQFQRMALIFLFRVNIEVLQAKLYQKEPSDTGVSYGLFELASKLSVPTFLLFESSTHEWIIAVQVIINQFLFAPILLNLITIRKEKFEYSKIKYRSQIDEQENINYTLNLLNRSYNMHNQIEYSLQKQFMGNEQSSFQQIQKFFLASFFNVFPHILLIPTCLWCFFIWMTIYHDNGLVSPYKDLMIFFNILTSLGMLLDWFQSMQIQKTYTIRDQNHLRLVQTFWYNLSQLIVVSPMLVQMIYAVTDVNNEFDQNSTFFYFNLSIVLILQVGNLAEFFYAHPYMQDYKSETILLVIPFTITIIISMYFQHEQIEMISIALITVPLSSRLLNEIKGYLNEEILYNSQYKEKFRKSSKVVSRTGLLMEEEEQFVIEKEINRQRQVQLEFMQTQNQKYFIHYLRLVDLMRLDDQQSIEKDASIININRSKFILNVIVLLKQHIAQCENVYCYCKGFRGERRRIIENNYHQLDMRIYSSIKLQNLTIQVELIKRYIRYNAKMIFELEREKENFDIIRITQLLTYLCSSEECYQILLLIMEIKEKLKSQNNTRSSVALMVLLSYAKHQILQKMNPLVKIDEVEAALQYKDYRVTEIRRDKLIGEMFANIQMKYDFLRKMVDIKYNYETLYKAVSQMVKYNLKVIQKIEQFNEFSFSRTSTLVYMFYTLEIINDFDKFIRLRNHLKTKNFKFFEFGTTNNQLAQKVCYLKINLARHAHKGKISRGEIIQCSNNAAHMFGYGSREFKEEVLTVHQLVSPHLSTIHDQLMEIFLLTNRPQILRKKRGLLAHKKNKDLLFVEMFIDVSFNISGDIFPIYGFLKQIKSDGAYENIKGHIFLNNELKIEGVSTLALEQFKLKDGKYLFKKKIHHMIQNFKKYQDLLTDKEKKFYETENQRQEAGSCAQQLSYNDTEQLLNHFTVNAEDLLFRLPKDGAAPDIYCISCKFIMTIGRINSKEYKSYLLQFQKITFADNTSQVWIESSRNLQTKTRTETQVDLSQNRDLTGSEKHSKHSDKQSEKLFTESDQECEFSQINEKNEEQSLNFEEYQFQIAHLNHLNLQSPFDSQRDLLSLMNDEKFQNPNINNQQDQNIISVQMDGQSQQQLQPVGLSKNQEKVKYQQSFFYKSVSKKSIDFENNQSENHNDIKDQDLKITQTPTTVNAGQPSIIQKTHLYSKFSSKDNNPRLINFLFFIDFLNLALLISLSLIFYLNFKTKLEDNMKIVEILRAFVTTDYTKNTLMAMGINTSQQDELSDEDQIYQDKLFQMVENNSQIYLTHYQQYLDESLVKSTLSNIYIQQFDFYSRTEQQVNAWTEQFYVIYLIQGLNALNLANQTTIQRFQRSISSLLSQYSVHKEAYEELTVQFTNQLSTNVSDLENQQNVCLILFSLIEVLFLLSYFIIYNQIFKLMNRILRSCEQISFKNLETESLRLISLLHRYQSAQDLNLYKHQYQIRDKSNSEVVVQLNKLQKSNLKSMKIQQFLQQQEQKKQFLILDEKPYFQRFFFLISMLTYIIGFSYFLTLKIFNSSNISHLQTNLGLYNENIIFTEQFFQMMMGNQILSESSIAEEYNIVGDSLSEYSALVNSSYEQVVIYGQKITSEAEQNYVDILQFLTTNSCSIIQDPLCNTVIDGKITQGLIYSTDYFVQKVRDNINSNYTQSKDISVSDLIGLNFISQGWDIIMDQGQSYLSTEFNSEIDIRTILFAVFLVAFFLYQTLASFFTFRFFKNRFFTIRQLPYVLPPQSVYGEDSFLKTLVYVEKIYDNFFQ